MTNLQEVTIQWAFCHQGIGYGTIQIIFEEKYGTKSRIFWYGIFWHTMVLKYGVIFFIPYRTLPIGLIQSVQNVCFVETRSHTKFSLHSYNKNCIFVARNSVNCYKFDLA